MSHEMDRLVPATVVEDADDFDALFAASSLGSPQARKIRAKAPQAARHHARRILGQSCLEPADVDADMAVGGLVAGMAQDHQGYDIPHLNAMMLLAPGGLSKTDHLQESERRDFVFASCLRVGAMGRVHRVRMLQSLVDHDALHELRPDVAWIIVDSALTLPNPPSALRQCLVLITDDLAVSTIAAASSYAAIRELPSWDWQAEVVENRTVGISGVPLVAQAKGYEFAPDDNVGTFQQVMTLRETAVTALKGLMLGLVEGPGEHRVLQSPAARPAGAVALADAHPTDDPYLIPAGMSGDAVLRELTGCGRLVQVADASPANRAMLCAAAYAVAWPLVFNRLTRGVELWRGHRRCAQSVHDLAPECLDGFHEDVEAVVDDLLRHADRPIRNLEAWICARLQAATVNGHSRQRGARGALQRPRLPKWLSAALGDDPWLTDLAVQILTWVGVDATAGAGLWPLDTWTRRRAEVTGEQAGTAAGPGTVERELEQVLAAMRARPDWYAAYVERPFGHKQALPPAWAPAGGGCAAEPAPLPLDDPAEAADARLTGLAQDALEEILRRLTDGQDARVVVSEVIQRIFTQEKRARIPNPHDVPPPRALQAQVSALLDNPTASERVIRAVLNVIQRG